MSESSPILVTGAHRSGTTWVGRMLAADRDTAYISEPLNVYHRVGIYRAPLHRWYTYITGENAPQYLPAFHELLGFRYHLFAELGSIRSRRDFMRMGRDLAVFTAGRLQKRRVLIKDPFAVFSVPWFVRELNCRVVITVRHPAGFASSLKRLDWPFDFRDLLDQPLLMRDHLEQDRSDMESMQAEDVIGQAALLWRLIYRVVDSIRAADAAVRIVRHEDLSLDPVGGYRALYGTLGLSFDEKAESTILGASSSGNPAEVSTKNMYSVKLDSRANMDNWKKRLTGGEVARIRKMTEPVSHRFYSDQEWI